MQLLLDLLTVMRRPRLAYLTLGTDTLHRARTDAHSTV